MATFTPTVKGKHVRVWLAPNGLSPAACPTLEGCMIAGEVSFNRNVTVTRKKCPSTIERGRFDTVYTVVQQDDPEITTSLENRLPADMRSLFLKLNTAGARFDMIWAYGVCSDPNDYNQFDRIEAFLDVIVTNYDHNETGAFDEENLSDDVLETIEIEALEYFDYTKPTQRVADTYGATVYDIVIADTRNNADTIECDNTVKTDGTQRIFTLVGDATDLFIRYSTDGGTTWSTSPALTVMSDPLASPTSLTWVGRYLVVSAQSAVNGDVDYAYALRDDILSGAASPWTAVSGASTPAIGRGFSLRSTGRTYFAGAAGALRYIDSNVIGTVSDVTGSPIGAGAWAAIHGHDAASIFAVGATDTVAKISDGVATAATATGGGNGLTAVYVLSRSKIIAGDDTGDLYYSSDGAVTWSLVASLGSQINALTFANRLIGYAVAGDTLYYTADGGCTWTAVDSSFTLAAAPTSPTSIYAKDNGNFVFFNSATEMLVAEDTLRLTYGAI